MSEAKRREERERKTGRPDWAEEGAETVDGEARDEGAPVTREASPRARLGIRTGIRLAADQDAPETWGEGKPAGKYAVLGEIARGGMGAVLRALDQDVNRTVAMKVILGGDEGTRVDRFIEEAQITGQLEHPNIVPVHEISEDEHGRLYFTMKMVRGESLESILDRLGEREEEASARYALSRLLEIFLKVCEAVAFAHDKGVIHRDLKPENVMVGTFGEVLVMDWGLAKVHGKPDQPDDATRQTDRPDRSESVAAQKGSPNVPGRKTGRTSPQQARTVDGEVLGTPAYMPPEQAAGRIGEVDRRSDVFSLGAILYKMLTHVAPYEEDDLPRVLLRAVQRDLVPPRKRAPWLRIPPELASICMKAMARRPEDRYPAVDVLMEDIRAFGEHRLVRAHRYGIGARFLRFVQRHPAGSLASAVALILLAAGGAVTGVMAERTRTADAKAEAERLKRREADKEKAQAEQSRELQRLRAERAEWERELESLRAARAEGERDEALSVLEKSRRAWGLLSRFENELGTDLADVKRVFYSTRGPDEREKAVDALQDPIERFAATVGKDSASRATLLALKGWLDYLAGRREDALERFGRSHETDPQVPFGPLFDAVALLAIYMEKQELPPLVGDPREVFFFAIPPETQEMETLRERFAERLEAVQACGAWGEESREDLARLMKGFAGFRSGDWQRAEAGLSAALAVPELRFMTETLLLARGRIRFLLRDFPGAAKDAERVLQAAPEYEKALFLLGIAWQAQALRLRGEARDPREALKESLRAMDRLLELHPGHGSALLKRGMLRLDLAQTTARADGVDPRPEMERARADMEKAVRTKLEPREGWTNLGLLYHAFSVEDGVRGGDARPWIDKALACYDKALDEDPGYWPALFNRAFELERIDRPEEAVEEYEKILARLGEDAPEDVRKHLARARHNTQGPPWGRLFNTGAGFLKLGDWRSARRFFGRALERAKKDGVYENAGMRPYVTAGHFYCAYLDFAFWSGRWGERMEDPAPPGPEKAASLKASGLAHLERSIELGIDDLQDFASDQDPDFAAVRALPEVKALVERWKRERK